MGIPVTVVDDDGVSSGEVDAQAAGAGGQQEDEDIWVGVEGLDAVLARLLAVAAINPARLVALPIQVGKSSILVICIQEVLLRKKEMCS